MNAPRGSLVLTARHGRVFRITLNRPEKRNALSLALCHELLKVFRQAEADEQVRVVVLDAAGPAFSAGMDLSEVLEPDFLRQADVHEELFTLGLRYSKPIVAAVHGAVFGGAVALVASAHLVVAAEDARFCSTEIHIGMWPYVAFRSIVAAIGERRATELAITGRVASASEAYEWGLVHRLAPAEKVLETALRLATEIASFDPVALSQGLLFVQQSRRLPAEEVGLLARQFRERAVRSSTFRSAIQAFLNKRSSDSDRKP